MASVGRLRRHGGIAGAQRERGAERGDAEDGRRGAPPQDLAGGRTPARLRRDHRRHHGRGQQDHERPGVGVGVRAAEDVADEALAGDPHQEGRAARRRRGTSRAGGPPGVRGRSSRRRRPGSRPSGSPWSRRGWPRLVRKWAYQPGTPSAMPAMALWIDVRGPVGGQQEEHGGQRPVPGPHGQRRDRAPDALGGGGGGHAGRPVAPVDRSAAAAGARPSGRGGRTGARRPGRPVSALALPVRSMPRPSPMTQTPSTQTNDTASAGRTVRRKSRPTPMKSWISAKKVFHTAMSGATKFPMWVMRSPRTKGCPLALGRMNVSTKPRPNMKGWNCRAASRIQKRPRTTWSTRWERTASGKRLCLAVVLGVVLRAPVVVHALTLRYRRPADGGQGRPSSGQLEVLGDAVRSASPPRPRASR